MNSSAEDRQAGARPRRGRVLPVARVFLVAGSAPPSLRSWPAFFAFQGATAVNLHADAHFPRAEGRPGTAVLCGPAASSGTHGRRKLQLGRSQQTRHLAKITRHNDAGH